MKTAIRMKHPLRSTGTHQTARLLRAIAPGHFRLDERSMQDLITAAHSYARMLTYVDPGGQADGDWTAFWEVENLTYMAVLAAIDTEQLRKGYEDIDLAFGQVLIEQEGRPKKGKKNASKDPVSPDFFRQLLCYLRDMAAALEKHYATLRPEIPLKDLLLQLIRRDNHATYEPDEVESALQQLVAYHKAADDNLDPETYKVFFQPDSRWGIRNRDEYDCILPDELYDREKVRGLFVQLFNIFLTLKARAQQMFDAEVALLELPEETLERRLEPHIALFITFLQLFRHAQEGMNDIPRRHLDFYYHSVLCLERRPADPDHAYLIFTLAKEFNEELVEKGTLLLAGKDKNGRPIQFETLERWKVTKASVEEIRNTCIAPEFINASTVSEKGAPPEKAFRAFGDDDTASEEVVPSNGDNKMEEELLGFAIASPQLFLQEGKREVEVRLNLQGPIEYANEYPEFVSVKYSAGEQYETLEKLASGKSGFVLSPLIAPFTAIQSAEPARRIVNDLVSDICDQHPSVFQNLPDDPLLAEVKKVFERNNITGTGTELTHFVFSKIFYPCLSGVYGVRQLLEKDKTEKKLTAQFKAELLFYRAYYLYTLGSVFAPAYRTHFDAAGSPQAGEAAVSVPTIIPDLRNNDLPEGSPTLVLYDLKDIYQDILNDLGEAGIELGQTVDQGKNTDSKTSINYYTVQALLSRIYLQMGRWGDCNTVCDAVIDSGKFALNNNAQEKPLEKLNATFDSIKDSPEVIWALETARGDDGASLFDFLGYYNSLGGESSRRFFGESGLLDALYRGNHRYEERSPHTQPLPPGGRGQVTPGAGAASVAISGTAEAPMSKSAKSKGGSTSQKNKVGEPVAAWEGHPAEAHYDIRDLAYYQSAKPIGDPESTVDVAFCNKYFRNNQTLVPMLRIAEVYLNKVQSLFELDESENQNKIRIGINQLRKRAGALQFLTESDLVDFPFDGYQVSTIEQYHIEEERARELAFEGDRREYIRAIKTGFVSRVISGNVEDLPSEALFPSPDERLMKWGAVPVYTITAASEEIIKIQQTTQITSLALKLNLKEDAPAFAPDNHLRAAGITPYPILRVAFGGTNSESSRFYNFLKKQTLTSATIKVKVTGIQKNIVLQNDFGVFDGTQRFYPFGPVPENSARFFLGCQEAFTKKLDSVDVTFDWVEEEDVVNGKKGYEDIYAKYQELATDIGFPPSTVGTGAKQKSNEGLAADIESTPSIILPIKLPFPQPRVTIDLLKEAEFSTPLLLRGNLFTPPLRFESGNQVLASKKSRMVRLFDKLTVAGFDRIISSEQVSKYSATQKRGFLRFKLEGDFGHKAFSFLVTKAAAQNDKGATLPHEPYTPATNSVSLNYTSEQTMEDKPNTDQFFHLLPFGGMRQSKFGTGQTSLVYGYPGPVPEPPTGGFYPANLFLGMKSLVPGDNLSLLFQTAEGSEREPDSRPPKVGWMYLTKDNEWVEFPAQKILRDTTRGLTRSGIIQLATPNDPDAEISSAGNTMLNPALLWLRASVVEVDEQIAPEKVAAFPDLLDIRAQVIEAQFLPAEGNDLERLDSPLPAQSVSGLAESSSAIKKAEQPYATFGGRKPEVEGSSEYHRRVSERLRHKDRAITAWDYERLLLEQYPLAAIAKCIPHTRYESTEGFAGATELAPGFVTIAVVPDLVRRPNMVRSEPRFSRGDLEEMRDFLVPKANAFVQTVENKHTDKRTDYLQVVNPQYEPVSVALRVWLVRGADQNLAKYELEQALRHFFSPWLKDPERLPQFSRVVRRSHLIQMIEQLDYIDAIEEMAVFHPIDREILSGKPINTIKDEHEKPVWGTWETTWGPLMVQGTLLTPGTARSILTTGEHSIEISDGVGGKGGPAPRAALAPPEMPAESQPSSLEPQPSSLSQQPATSNRKPTAKRK